MSVPDEYSTWCEFDNCGSYNVNGYCEACLVNFFNWLNKNKRKLTEDNFDDLKEEFVKDEESAP